MHARALIATVACLAASALPGSVAEAQRPALARTVRQYARAHAFSGTVLVRKGGRTLYHESFGLADRAFGVPVTNGTRFRAASITKAFTAVLVLQLVEQGKVELRAPVSAYLPDYRGEGAGRVSIHHLLNHTSGIENFDQVTSYEAAVRTGIESYQLPHTTDELLTKYASGKMVREPGKEFDSGATGRPRGASRSTRCSPARRTCGPTARGACARSERSATAETTSSRPATASAARPSGAGWSSGGASSGTTTRRTG